MCLSFKKLALLDMVRDKYGTTGRFALECPPGVSIDREFVECLKEAGIDSSKPDTKVQVKYWMSSALGTPLPLERVPNPQIPNNPKAS